MRYLTEHLVLDWGLSELTTVAGELKVFNIILTNLTMMIRLTEHSYTEMPLNTPHVPCEWLLDVLNHANGWDSDYVIVIVIVICVPECRSLTANQRPVLQYLTNISNEASF